MVAPCGTCSTLGPTLGWASGALLIGGRRTAHKRQGGENRKNRGGTHENSLPVDVQPGCESVTPGTRPARSCFQAVLALLGCVGQNRFGRNGRLLQKSVSLEPLTGVRIMETPGQRGLVKATDPQGVVQLSDAMEESL